MKNQQSTRRQYEQPAQFFKLLAHPARLAVLQALREGEACVCHLEATLGFRQAYLSQQLALLREAGLVGVRREGWNVYYQINHPELGGVLDEAMRLTDTPLSLPDMHPVDCPCPKCSHAFDQA